jgi:N-acetyl-anhydromuramyl-L-alanine amidase AmpD
LTLDSGDAVAESNEADNMASDSVQLAAPAQAAGGEPSWTLWNPALFFTKGRSKAVDSIVIHTTEGSYAGAISWFKNPANTGQTSAHYVISPTGEVTQMVLLENTAHHATYYNSRAIGIEVAGYASSAATWTPEVQAALKRLVGYLVTRFAIPVSHPAGDARTYAKLLYDEPGIVGHSQIQPVNNTAYPYSLKSDPGPFFDWSIFMPAVVAENHAGTLSFAAASAARTLALATGTETGPWLQLDLPAERIVCLESSPDLMSWTPESTFVAPGGLFSIALDPLDAVQKFYRLKWGVDRE